MEATACAPPSSMSLKERLCGEGRPGRQLEQHETGVAAKAGSNCLGSRLPRRNGVDANVSTGKVRELDGTLHKSDSVGCVFTIAKRHTVGIKREKIIDEQSYSRISRQGRDAAAAATAVNPESPIMLLPRLTITTCKKIVINT